MSLMTGAPVLADQLAIRGIWPDEQPSSRIDAPSLALIVIISCLCLLASLWAVLSGTDLGANIL